MVALSNQATDIWVTVRLQTWLTYRQEVAGPSKWAMDLWAIVGTSRWQSGRPELGDARN